MTDVHSSLWPLLMTYDALYSLRHRHRSVDHSGDASFAFCLGTLPYRDLSVPTSRAADDVAAFHGAHGADGIVVGLERVLELSGLHVVDIDHACFGSNPQLKGMVIK